MKNLILSLSLFAVCLMFAPALEAQIPAPKQSEPIALVGGTIHTLAGDVIENGTILFEDGKITAVGTNVNVPSGARTEDVTGKHIYPGLIDSHNQMGIYEIGAVDMTVDVNEQGSINPNILPERAFHPESRHIGIARSAGVLTSVTSPGGGLISGQSSAMKMDGWAWDEMILKSSTGLIVNWPNPGSDDYEDNLRRVRDTFADAKAYRTAREAMNAGDAQRHDLDTRWEAMIPVLNGDVPVVVNASEVRQIQDAITWSEEEGVRLIILGGADSHLVTEHLRAKQIPVIITSVLTSSNRDWESYDARYSLPSKLHEAGVQFAIAGGSSAPYAHRLPYEAGAAAAFGLDADTALRALTTYPATILGLDDRIGTLEVGKDATLLITTGNPIEYSTQIEQVYVEGRESDMMDMHRQLYQKYREKVDQRNAEK
ncbi:amidohydrolase family protein [Rhodohalobacter sp.]|uniref:amidohydrolase family protein n=1 Tax=Rhodohalobacter sp. TaxID=1974210 RepID=UPI002ACE45DA|nr:amidohydrolase family protein [Rhodohalobacter sp.]MDZ7757129.1 amidohydrolase family protein [Rhodohalobacter sp.]